MRGALLIPIALSACSSSDAGLAALKGARSVVAEWAAVARLETAGRVNRTYADGMARDAKAQLASERAALKLDDPAARLIDGLGPTPDPAQLTRTAAALGQLEEAREGR